jgi:hypothetical protein
MNTLYEDLRVLRVYHAQFIKYLSEKKDASHKKLYRKMKYTTFVR